MSWYVKISMIILAACGLLAAGCSEVKQVRESEIIPYKTVRRKDPSLPAGQTRLAEAGEQGIMTVVYQDTYSWGRKVGRKRAKARTEVEPKSEIISIGAMEAVSLNAGAPAGTLEITLSTCRRYTKGYGTGRNRIESDALVIVGEVMNRGTRAVETDRTTNLVLIHRGLRGGRLSVAATPVTVLVPGETRSLTWIGSLNTGRSGVNAAIAEASDIRVAVSTTGGTTAGSEERSLAGLAQTI